MRVLFAAILVCLFTQAHAEESWTVVREQAECLFENLPDYLESDDEPIIIFLNVCPTVDRMEALSKLQQNIGALPPGPTIIITPEGEEREIDDVLVYTQAELACLQQTDLPDAEGIVLLPVEPCAQ